MTQPELYERFAALHERDGGFIMPNAWDGASALLLKQAGFEALGTSSAAIASALGRLDGRHAVSREEHLAHATCSAPSRIFPSMATSRMDTARLPATWRRRSRRDRGRTRRDRYRRYDWRSVESDSGLRRCGRAHA